MEKINAVTGPISAEQLGRTMMHEHLVVATPGWESDTAHPGPDDRQLLAICVDRISALKDQGIRSFVDPCPGDIGRNAALAAEVSVRTGMQIIAATGLFCETFGGATYWKSKMWAAALTGNDLAPYMAEVFIKEITEGIGNTGVKAGIIKVATDRGAITEYERMVFRAAAMASIATDTPITTHTQQGQLGREQQELLMSHGVPAHRIIIGHSCGSPDFDYHMAVTGRGSYLGFDRFGYQVGDFGRPDDEKIDSLMKVIRAGRGRQVVVSCDYVCAYRGSGWPDSPLMSQITNSESILHFVQVIVPKLKALGITQAELDDLMMDNPRRYFSGTAVS